MQLLEDLTIKQQLRVYIDEIEGLLKQLILDLIDDKIPVDFDKANEFIERITILENQFNNNVNVDLVAMIELQLKMDMLQEEYQSLDELINEYFILLKKSEEILATSIYNAQQKLTLIEKNRSNASKHTPDYFVKFAHHISANNSISAPQNWTLGDQKRPFPQDFEMRQGMLANIDNVVPKKDISSLSFGNKSEASKSGYSNINDNSNFQIESGITNDSMNTKEEEMDENSKIKDEMFGEEIIKDELNGITNLSSPQIITPNSRGLSESSSSPGSSDDETDNMLLTFDYT